MKFYFAYGSNMGSQQMLARYPGSRRLGLAQLQGWRWIIAADGYANVVPAANETVEGVLFEIRAADEVAMDRYEEISAGCYAKQELSVLYEGNSFNALVYVGPVTPEGVAAPEYIPRLQTALADAGLNADYSARLLRCFLNATYSGN